MKQAEFAAGLTYDELPLAVIERAKNIILDSAGCVLKGFLQDTEKTQSNLDEELISLAMSMISTELYEGNRKAIGHPACHILPLMFMQARSGEMSYKEFIVNFVAAYEIAGRWGSAITFSHDILGHGTVMTAGAVVAEGLFRKASAEEIYEALLIEGALPEVSVWQSVWDGSALHDAYAGLSAEKAKKSFFLYRNGVRSTGKIITSVYHDVMGANIDEKKLAMGLSEEYLLLSNYYKVHTGCRFVHPFADLIQKQLDEGMDKAAVDRIDIYTYKKAARLTAQSVPNKLAGQFSIPVSIAVQLEKGELSPDTIALCVNDPDIKAWEGRITLYEDEKYNELLPDTRGGRMEITYKSGEKKSLEVFHAIGDFDNPKPYDREDIFVKFKKNASDKLSCEAADKLITALMEASVDEPMNRVLSVFYKNLYE